MSIACVASCADFWINLLPARTVSVETPPWFAIGSQVLQKVMPKPCAQPGMQSYLKLATALLRVFAGWSRGHCK